MLNRVQVMQVICKQAKNCDWYITDKVFLFQKTNSDHVPRSSSGPAYFPSQSAAASQIHYLWHLCNFLQSWFFFTSTYVNSRFTAKFCTKGQIYVNIAIFVHRCQIQTRREMLTAEPWIKSDHSFLFVSQEEVTQYQSSLQHNHAEKP